jgi:sec-independent protein translocase protein TatA
MNSLASFFNLAGPDLIIILVIVLLLFGAKKLPELARGLGQAVKEFSKAKDDFEREVTHPVSDASRLDHSRYQETRTEDPSHSGHSAHSAHAGHDGHHASGHGVAESVPQGGTQAAKPEETKTAHS